MNLEPYCCPCGACIEGLRLQLRRASDDEDMSWLQDSLDASLEARREISRYREADERREREAKAKEARRALG